MPDLRNFDVPIDRTFRREINVISYHPPKARIWGHRRGRLTAVELWRRAEGFLRDQVEIVGPPQQWMEVVWMLLASDPVSVAVEEFARIVGIEGATTESESQVPKGVYRRTRWELPYEATGVAAAWVDDYYSKGLDQQSLAILGTQVWLRWKAPCEQPHVVANEPLSVFGVQLTRPRGVTTIFNFRDVGHYRHIKQYLADCGLVVLSDNHVRPRSALIA